MEKIATEKRHIAILMATYNGERYLKEQIDSLYNQTSTSWTLYIHDDGSTDNTMAIISHYSKTHGNIKVLDYPEQHGAKANFMSMIQAVDADYYFLCDQDDKWCLDKIEQEMDRMEQMESQYPDRPVLVFSDIYVADSQLNVISDSLWKMSGARPEFLTTFAECGATPFVTGCTMLFNKKARETIVFPFDKATMHDAWITLCILRHDGIISAIRAPLLYYRQHEKNTLGASDRSRNTLAHKLCNVNNIIKRDKAHWQMLKALKYGSLLKHLRYKLIYKTRCRAK